MSHAMRSYWIGLAVGLLAAMALVVMLNAGGALAGPPAQGIRPGTEPASPEAVSAVGNYIPVQGRLTNASGNSLTGTYTITFRLYNVFSEGTELCHDTNSVWVNNGLFNSEIWGNCGSEEVNGQQLYLGIEVDSDGEMTPRQPIYASPYAWSLRPGAIISSSFSSDAIVHIENSGSGGRGLRAYATSTTGANWGIVGASTSPDGYGGYFYNSRGGTGLKTESDTGVALSATGSGIIKSTADSYIFVPGAAGVLHGATTGATLKYWGQGEVEVESTSDVGAKEIIFPVTLPASLYGQSVRVEQIAFSFKNTGDLANIGQVQVYRTRTDGTYRTIVNNTNGGAGWTGLTYSELTFDISSDNVLTSSDGYLTVRVTCNIPAGNEVRFTGVRVRLGHN